MGNEQDRTAMFVFGGAECDDSVEQICSRRAQAVRGESVFNREPVFPNHTQPVRVLVSCDAMKPRRPGLAAPCTDRSSPYAGNYEEAGTCIRHGEGNLA